jgi:cytochrome c oxidase subunit 1
VKEVSTATLAPAPVAGHAEPKTNYLNHTHGFWSWALTLDHKRIGLMYLVGVLSSFLMGGIFALMVRLELWSPGLTFVTADTYNKLFTLHGAIMVFLVIIPGIPAALGNFVLPMMLGAKDVAFPRLNLLSYYLYVLGTIIFLTVLFVRQVDTGWTFYTPYSTTTNTNAAGAMMGAFVLGFSSILTGLNFMATIHSLRPPGMTWFKMPLFLWALYATSIINVLATPVLAITLLLATVDRLIHLGIFDPAYGGDPVLFQHFFWFYSHPAVYIMILPALGIVSELISTFSKKHIFGYKFIAFSSVALALFGFLVWGHHLFTSGQSPMASVLFSFLTFSVSIPTAIKIFNWIATLYKGSITFETPMLYALSFIFLFAIGGFTGLFLAVLSIDIHLHDTYFVVSHFHYVMMGGTIISFLGGLFYWWPKMFGRMYNENMGRLGCLIVFLGFNLTFFPQFVMGSKGMPRRYYDFLPEFDFYHKMSTIGALTLGCGLLLSGITLFHAVFWGRKAPANPWGSATMEWQSPSPPPHDNFTVVPPVIDPYDHEDLEYVPADGGYVLRPQPGHG